MVLLATFFYGLTAQLARRPSRQKYGSLVVTSRMLALAAIWTAPFGIWGLTDSEFAWSSAAATAVLGVLGTGLAFGLMGTLIARVGGPRASFITYLIPVVACSWAPPSATTRSHRSPWPAWCWWWAAPSSPAVARRSVRKGTLRHG